MQQNRENWTAVRNNGRYIVIDKITNEIINTCQGYGFKTEATCKNWIRNMQRQVGIVTREHATDPLHSYPLF